MAGMAGAVDNLPPEIRRMVAGFLGGRGDDAPIDMNRMAEMYENLPPEIRAMASEFLQKRLGAMSSGDEDDDQAGEDDDDAASDAQELLRSMPWVLLDDATNKGSKCDDCPSKGSCKGGACGSKGDKDKSDDDAEGCDGCDK